MVWVKGSGGDGGGLVCITEWRIEQLGSIQYRTRTEVRGQRMLKQKQEPEGTPRFLARGPNGTRVGQGKSGS